MDARFLETPMDDMSSIIPRDLHEGLAWLGRQDWHDYKMTEGSDGDKLSSTVLWENFIHKPEAEKYAILIHTLYRITTTGYDALALSQLEAGSHILANGPKLFQPTDEQFESMAQVELHMPVTDFRAPYPGIVVRIPNEWRNRTAKELGLDPQTPPLHVIVRCLQKPGKPQVLFTSTNWRRYEIAHLMGEGMRQKTIEDCLVSRANNVVDRMFAGPEGEYEYSNRADRAALNMCLMMAHFGCRLAGPLDPRRYQKNRKENSPLRHGDFLAIEMTQDIVIRREERSPSTQIGEDDPDRPKLWEVKPHWRRGHWRRKPGWEHYIERNEKPPLVFVRPTLVRRDRVSGEIGHSKATYQFK